MTLQIYIFRQLLFAFSFAVAGISMIVLPTVLIQAIHRLGAVSLGSILSYLPLVLVELVPYILPMSFLLGVVSTYGRLAAERELIAIRMAGIHPARLTLPALVLAGGLGLLTNHLMSEVGPQYKYEARTYLRTVRLDAFRTLAQGRNHLEFGNSTLDWEGRDANGVLLGVFMKLAEEEGKETLVTASSAEIGITEEIFHVQLTDARVVGDGARIYNENPVWSVPLSTFFKPEGVGRSRAKYLGTNEMKALMLAPDVEPEVRDGYVFEINRRRALSVTYLLFVLLGVPTGIMLRSGTQLSAFTGAVGYAFVYFVFALQLGKSLAQAGTLAPLPAAWSTAALFLVLGLFLSHRALFR